MCISLQVEVAKQKHVNKVINQQFARKVDLKNYSFKKQHLKQYQTLLPIELFYGVRQ
eukprot:GDKH01025545.1.p1 GENE.GDKH01025545.1~~GDKH01025545.1.p1  ORF type:complete len:57 (-),score=3.40 GDKH01025545.1:63-233(-)